MRAIITTLAVATLGLSSQALAGSGTMGSGYNVSSESGVTVYRGEHPDTNFRAVAGQQAAAKHREKVSALKTEVYKKSRALAKERRRTAELEERVEKLEARQERRSQRRARYGRSYFGNNRFFGPNGFAGNSNFSGANAVGPVRRPYKRRRHHP